MKTQKLNAVPPFVLSPVIHRYAIFIPQDSCDDWVTALCPDGKEGCPDNEGDYDVFELQPMSGTSGSGYKVHVMDVSIEGVSDCSHGFYLSGSPEAPAAGDAGCSVNRD